MGFDFQPLSMKCISQKFAGLFEFRKLLYRNFQDYPG